MDSICKAIRVHCADCSQVSSEMLFSLLLDKGEIAEITRLFHFKGIVLLLVIKEVSVVSWIKLGHSNMQSVSMSARYFSFDLYCLQYWH